MSWFKKSTAHSADRNSVNRSKAGARSRASEIQVLEQRLYFSTASPLRHVHHEPSHVVGHALHLAAAANHAAKQVLGQATHAHASHKVTHSFHPRLHVPTKPAHKPAHPRAHAPAKPHKPAHPKPTAKPKGNAKQLLASASASQTPKVTLASAMLASPTAAPLTDAAATGGTMQVGATAIPSVTDPLYSITVQKDGKIVILGAHNGTFSILRYATTGKLDQFFGTAGSAAVNFNAGSDTAHAVAVDYTGTAAGNPNYGKIVVAGSSIDGFVIARFNPNGTLDTTFGTAGKVRGVLTGGSADGLIIAPNGQILVGGSDASGNPVVIRLNSKGVQDLTFGTKGVYHGPLTDLNGSHTTATATATASTCGSCGSCGGCSYSAPNVSFCGACSGYNATEGASFCATGFISDPNPSQCLSGTVNYGDGTGTQPLSISGATFTLSHTYAEEANDTISIVVTDSNDNQQGGGCQAISVNDVAPSAVSFVGGSGARSTIAGTTFTGTGSFSDVDYTEGGTTYSATVNYGDGSGTQNLSLSGNSYSLSHVYWVTTPQNTPDTVTVTINKLEGGQATSASGQLPVNVTPITVASPGSTQQGLTYTATLSSGSIGGRTINSWIVNWGDGSVPQQVSGSPSVSHTYSSSPAGLTITAAAYDSSGAILATYTLPNQSLISNFGSTIPGTNYSVIVLDATASGALTASGNGLMMVSGMVAVDSSSSSALTATGNANLNANPQPGSISVHGGDSISGNATVSPTPITSAAVVPDPLSGLTAPTPGTSYPAVKLTGGSQTISPGTYSSISVSGTGSLTLNPGVYTIQGGGFSVSGKGSVSGSGVSIVNTSD
ncbi:MAG: hypothetical protein JWL97_3622, partial [Gemmatimonadales bacterium]|nr:hypothetical protein [Gemmatimonadales bacterium]